MSSQTETLAFFPCVVMKQVHVLFVLNLLCRISIVAALEHLTPEEEGQLPHWRISSSAPTPNHPVRVPGARSMQPSEALLWDTVGSGTRFFVIKINKYNIHCLGSPMSSMEAQIRSCWRSYLKTNCSYTSSNMILSTTRKRRKPSCLKRYSIWNHAHSRRQVVAQSASLSPEPPAPEPPAPAPRPSSHAQLKAWMGHSDRIRHCSVDAVPNECFVCTAVTDDQSQIAPNLCLDWMLISSRIMSKSVPRIAIAF